MAARVHRQMDAVLKRGVVRPGQQVGMIGDGRAEIGDPARFGFREIAQHIRVDLALVARNGR